MAINSGRLLMRRGNEADFDADKLMPGEWAVSTDKRYVRMCFSPGVCVRMATYDAFEEDMVKIEEILRNCQDIQEAIERINTEVSQKANAAAEYTEKAKQYRDEASQKANDAAEYAEKAKQYRDEAKTFTPEGYELMAEQIEETSNKVDIIIAKSDLGIKNKASGEIIHVQDSSAEKVVEYSLFGKATQNGEPTPENPVEIEITGADSFLSYNMLNNIATSQNSAGIEFTVNEDKSITVNANPSEAGMIKQINKIVLPKGNYIFTDGEHERNEKYYVEIKASNGNSNKIIGTTKKLKAIEFVVDGTYTEYEVNLHVEAGVVIENVTFYPMIRKASVGNKRYLPYGIVDDGKKRVTVKSVGKNFLKYPYQHSTRTINGVTFTVNDDGSVIVKGTNDGVATSDFFLIGSWGVKNNIALVPKEDLIISGIDAQANVGSQKISIRTYAFDGNGKSLGGVLDWGSGVNLSKDLITSASGIAVYMVVNSGVTVDTVVYPMIRLATDTDSTYEPYKEVTTTISTPNGAGIPVTSGGNYTDSNGQQWICDEIVKYADGSGEYVQRVGKVVFDGSSDEVWTYSEAGGAIRFLSGKIRDLVSKPLSASNKGNLICNLFKITTANNTYLGREEGIAVELNGNLSVYYSKWTSTNDIIESLANNNMIVYYELAEPIRTPLTAEETEDIFTHYPTTTIFNDFDCGMSVKYICDSKNYIDNQLALQAQAREQEMLNMFLLLPEETQAAMIENDINNLLLESGV